MIINQLRAYTPFNEQEAFDIIKDRVAEYEKDNPKYKDDGIKNIKTNRSQWFD